MCRGFLVRGNGNRLPYPMIDVERNFEFVEKAGIWQGSLPWCGPYCTKNVRTDTIHQMRIMRTSSLWPDRLRQVLGLLLIVMACMAGFDVWRLGT